MNVKPIFQSLDITCPHIKEGQYILLFLLRTNLAQCGGGDSEIRRRVYEYYDYVKFLKYNQNGIDTDPYGSIFLLTAGLSAKGHHHLKHQQLKIKTYLKPGMNIEFTGDFKRFSIPASKKIRKTASSAVLYIEDDCTKRGAGSLTDFFTKEAMSILYGNYGDRMLATKNDGTLFSDTRLMFSRLVRLHEMSTFGRPLQKGFADYWVNFLKRSRSWSFANSCKQDFLGRHIDIDTHVESSPRKKLANRALRMMSDLTVKQRDMAKRVFERKGLSCYKDTLKKEHRELVIKSWVFYPYMLISCLRTAYLNREQDFEYFGNFLKNFGDCRIIMELPCILIIETWIDPYGSISNRMSIAMGNDSREGYHGRSVVEEWELQRNFEDDRVRGFPILPPCYSEADNSFCLGDFQNDPEINDKKVAKIMMGIRPGTGNTVYRDLSKILEHRTGEPFEVSAYKERNLYRIIKNDHDFSVRLGRAGSYEIKIPYKGVFLSAGK